MEYIIGFIIALVIIGWISKLISNFVARRRYNKTLNKVLQGLQNIDFNKIAKINTDHTAQDAFYGAKKKEFNDYISTLIKDDIR
jgi:hypothetical protein